MATVMITQHTQGWQLEIYSGGVEPTISSDRGQLNVSFTTPAPGQVNIRADSDIMLPDAAGGGHGETILINLTIDSAAGTVVGTINGKGMGKGR